MPRYRAIARFLRHAFVNGKAAFIVSPLLLYKVVQWLADHFGFSQSDTILGAPAILVCFTISLAFASIVILFQGFALQEAMEPNMRIDKVFVQRIPAGVYLKCRVRSESRKPMRCEAHLVRILAKPEGQSKFRDLEYLDYSVLVWPHADDPVYPLITPDIPAVIDLLKWEVAEQELKLTHRATSNTKGWLNDPATYRLQIALTAGDVTHSAWIEVTWAGAPVTLAGTILEQEDVPWWRRRKFRKGFMMPPPG